MKGVMYLFFAFMLVACGNTGTSESGTTTGTGETTGTVATTEGEGGESASGNAATTETAKASQNASPFPEDEKMAFYCKKLYNKITGSNYNVTTAETYTKVVDQIGAPTFKGKKLENAEVRMMSMNYTDKESTIKLAELTGNLVLPKKPELVDYQPRGKNFFYDQGKCGCVQVFVPSGGKAGGQAGGYALENVFYYKKDKLVAVYDAEDKAVEMTEAHKTISVENLAQFEAVKKIQ
jgi:hypothetical protein